MKNSKLLDENKRVLLFRKNNSRFGSLLVVRWNHFSLIRSKPKETEIRGKQISLWFVLKFRSHEWSVLNIRRYVTPVSYT
jgi:hypothetical protein